MEKGQEKMMFFAVTLGREEGITHCECLLDEGTLKEYSAEKEKAGDEVVVVLGSEMSKTNFGSAMWHMLNSGATGFSDEGLKILSDLVRTAFSGGEKIAFRAGQLDVLGRFEQANKK